MLSCSCKFFYKKCFYKKEVQAINHIKAVVKKMKALYVRVSTDSQVAHLRTVFEMKLIRGINRFPTNTSYLPFLCYFFTI